MEFSRHALVNPLAVLLDLVLPYPNPLRARSLLRWLDGSHHVYVEVWAVNLIVLATEVGSSIVDGRQVVTILQEWRCIRSLLNITIIQ